MSRYSTIWLVLVSCFTVSLVCGRIHNLKLQNDQRHRMTLSTFGFLKGGTLAVNISMFAYKATISNIDDKIFGFTLDKSNSPGLSNYVPRSLQKSKESMAECIWNKPEDTLVSVFFKFDLENKRMNIERKGKALQHLKIIADPRKQYLFDQNLEHGENLAAVGAKPKVAAPSTKSTKSGEKKEGDEKTEDKKSDVEGKNADKDKNTTEEKKTDAPIRKAREASKEDVKKVSSTPKPASEKNVKSEDPKTDKDKLKSTSTTVAPKGEKGVSQALPDLPIEITDKTDLVTSLPMSISVKDTLTFFHTYFLVHMQSIEEEGLYNLFFHNCLKVDSLINLTVKIIEDNNGNYLSADEMPIPVLYFVFHAVFLVLTGVWFSVLRSADVGVYKLHYLMLVVVFVKSISCLFHGINMYMIQKNGIHVDAWAILWYIVYLTRGALMFVTVLLIGAGWAFIKHVFSDREKKLFLVVMPLQILANVAWVIVEESEEGTSSYTLWNRVFMVVDLLCCFAILFPVIWSIRHLQEASRTDGKAAINLNKLKLFRYFYILVVCYIYFTRIIVYLLKITLPFHYGWLRNLFAEVFLLCFFTLTGYKFRPTTDNPYLQVPLDSDDEIEMEEVLTKTGNMDTLSRVNQGARSEEGETTRTTVKQRESSHEFD